MRKDPTALAAALEGLRYRRAELDAFIEALQTKIHDDRNTEMVTVTERERGGAPPVRRSRSYSRAQRREISERMKRYWRMRRRAAAG